MVFRQERENIESVFVSTNRAITPELLYTHGVRVDGSIRDSLMDATLKADRNYRIAISSSFSAKWNISTMVAD